MSGGRLACSSGANGSAKPPRAHAYGLIASNADALTPPHPIGSVKDVRKEFVNWNAARSAPVATSPESCVSALVRLLPLKPKSDTNAGGSAPPLLKKLSIAWPTLS